MRMLLPEEGMMLQPDCDIIVEAIQSLTHEIEQIDYRIGVLEAEAMELNPLQYLVLQRKVDRLVSVKHKLQDNWNNAMNDLAICRSANSTQHYFDRDHVFHGR
jgi:hypothetical protein